MKGAWVILWFLWPILRLYRTLRGSRREKTDLKITEVGSTSVEVLTDPIHKDDGLPILLIEGLFGFGHESYWRGLPQAIETSGRRRKLIFAKPGAVSSVHDRACEIFYQIKGGRTDYGKEHSDEFGHQRYGKTHPGLYPEWDKDHPIHVLGHSLGGCTGAMLQHMLATNQFEGHVTHADMIRSFSPICSPMRGTTIIHLLGLRSGGQAGFALLSLSGIISRVLHFYQFIGLNFIWDFQMDHWPLFSLKRLVREGAEGIRMAVLWLITVMVRSPFAEGKDNAFYDLGLEGACQSASKIKMNPNTFYRSYAASMTRPAPFFGYHIPSNILHWPALLLLSTYIGSRTRSSLKKVKESIGTTVEQWFESDGVANTVSQYHPHSCREDYCQHVRGFPSRMEKRPALERGKWQVVELRGVTHFCLLPSFLVSSTQRQFYKDYLEFLEEAEAC
ncbi:lipase [Planoprotostelium fungivorum]|uniref:Lipase n=1 Tax=Planoprotostelium fungivorum TaxID=1890364 RepID=A0A2P6NC96_9EUKA|nr:lipase [Planoprotostelium fungivorum]